MHLFLPVSRAGCVGIGYLGDRNIRARSLKNGLILYEDFELRNEVTVTFPREGIFRNLFIFSFLIPKVSRLRRGII